MIDPRNWRNLEHIKTSSLWLEERGDFKLKPKDFGLAAFHGRYHPEIPYQMMQRYVAPRELVWDCFAGGGTTIDVGKFLGIEVIANDIQPQRPEIICADSRFWKPDRPVKLVMLHPPYWSMVKFSDNPADLCNCFSADEFIEQFSRVLDTVRDALSPGGYAVLVISDLYKAGEQWPLGAMLYQRFRDRGFALRGKIIKDFGETKGSDTTNAKNAHLWRYRKLKSGLWDLGLDEIWVYRLRK